MGPVKESKGRERKVIGREEEEKREDAHTRAAPRVFMTDDWEPGQQALAVIEGEEITTEFARSCLPEFRLYWKERNEARAGFDAAFVNRVKRCWAIAKREQKQNGHDQRTRPPGMTLGEWGNIQARRNLAGEFEFTKLEGSHAH